MRRISARNGTETSSMMKVAFASVSLPHSISSSIFLFTLAFCEKWKRRSRRKSEKDSPVQAIENNSRAREKQKVLLFHLFSLLSSESPRLHPFGASSSFDRLQLWDPGHKRNFNITDKFEKFHNWFQARENKGEGEGIEYEGWGKGKAEAKTKVQIVANVRSKQAKGLTFLLLRYLKLTLLFPSRELILFIPILTLPSPFFHQRGHKLEVDSTNWTRKLTSFRYQQFLPYITSFDTL